MYITNITDDYDNIPICNCTNNENDIDIIIPAFFYNTLWSIIFMFNEFDGIYSN